MTIVEAPPSITGGLDTHLDVHVAAALDPLAGSSAPSPSQRTQLVIERSSRGSGSSARSPRSVSREPVPMARGSPGSCAASTSTSSRSTGRTARRAGTRARPTPYAVEAARAALSGNAKGHAKTRDGALRGDPHARRGQALRAAVEGQGPRPDAPPRDQRTRGSSPAIQRALGRSADHRGRRTATGSLARSGHRGNQVVAVLARRSHPGPRVPSSPCSTEQFAVFFVATVAPACSASSGCGPDRRVIPRHRCRRQSRAAALRGRMGSAVRRLTEVGADREGHRSLPPTTEGTVRPTSCSGAS